MSKLRLILMLMVLWVAGCSTPQKPEISYTAPTLEKDWSVKMTLSGGIAGLMRNIEVKSDGSYVVTDERANSTVEGELTDAKLAELEELVSTLSLSTSKMPSVCADCFIYDVEIISNGQKMLVNADDVTLGDSGIGGLVQFLREIMDSALQ